MMTFVRNAFFALALVTFGVSSAEAIDLPLTRVVISNAGLAQFTHSGIITGGSSVELSVRLDQVDDILKSLTVFDEQGAIGAISLPGKTPLAELFSDLPFGPDALASPTKLLNALVGAEVEIAGNVGARGRIFRVENEKRLLPNNGGTTTRHRLTLLTDHGFVQAVFEDMTSLRFTEPAIQAQVDRALAGIAENRAKERRRLSIGFLGSGKRRVSISYVVAAPVWKTAYRLVLSKDGSKARLQGWAIVENLTGGDWKNVDLVLLSGNPVALHQPLYTAFYANRPEVGVATTVHIVPRADEELASRPRASRTKKLSPMSQQAAAFKRKFEQRGGQVRLVGRSDTPVAKAVSTAAQAEEAATQLVYRFPVKVSLATGHTMMVPFVDRNVTATRTWLYQPDTSARHPLAAMMVRNDGDTSLPAGIVTVYDTLPDGNVNFVGDAQLPLLSKAASKFVTFAMDAKSDIRREDKGVTRTVLGKALNGVLTITTRSRHTIAYEVVPPADEDRTIVIEEPRTVGWKPSAANTSVKETPTRFRFRIAAVKGQTAKTTFTIERTDSSAIILATKSAENILAHIRGLQNASAALKASVAKLAAIVADINKTKIHQEQLELERKKIVSDQERIRRNIRTVGQRTDLGRQYIDALRKQEERLGEISHLNQKLKADIIAKRQAAAQVAQQLSF